MRTAVLDDDFKLEILISTMNRTSLNFLKSMFKNNSLEKLNLLVINQTKVGKDLISDLPNVKVINTCETGLSKSRNLAIKNAVCDVCLISDDDVEYVKGFQEIIKEAFINNSYATVIKFKIEVFNGKPYKNYPKSSKKLIKKKDISTTSSIEIAFKREDIINNKLFFNTLFGLGSYFPSGEEYLFLSEVLKKNLKISFENRVIVIHDLKSSTSNLGSDNYIKTKSVIYYIDYKYFSFVLVVKLIFFLLRNKYISVNDIGAKCMVGIKAIKRYKKIIKEDGVF